MPALKLTDSQVAWVIRLVAAYIHDQRELFRRRAVPLNTNQSANLKPFFSPAILECARILSGERIANPLFYRDLAKVGFPADSLPDFRNMMAITYVDTVVSRDQITDRVLFHEMVHAVQYEKLKLEGFAAKYVAGFMTGGSYEAIPLEINANDLDARFAKSPPEPFSVEAEVDVWIAAGKF